MSNFEDIHIEKDFWDDFIVEAFEHIDEIETNAMSLEKNPEDMDIIHTMFRAFHTIKGLSGFVEHTIIQEIAHKTETMMDYCRKGELKVSTKIVDAILKSSDYIKKLCESMDAYKDKTLVKQIEDLLIVLEELSNVELFAEVKKEAAKEIKVEKIQEEEPVLEVKAEDKEAGLEIFAQEIGEIIDKQEIEVSCEETEDVLEEIAEEVIEPEPQSVDEEALKEFQKETIEKLQGKNTEKPEVVKEQVAAVVKSISANEEYMKVANYKIDHLVDMIGELIINQSLIEQYVASTYSEDRQLITNMSGFLRITRELQNLSMSLRMVSLKPTFQKISRIARDTIQELGKDVEFVTSGEATEIDRVVTDKLLDPLVHLIKNAISHGVEETSQDRTKIKKSPKARVELNAYSKRGKIFIEVKDDGRGINSEIVYQKAVEKGLIDPNKTYSEAEIKEFILLPGFSTAKVVDNISGRGVGMDVVKTQILKIGGKVEIQSKLNEGSTFTLEVPVNHAIMNGTIIEMQNQHFVVPTVNVKEFLQPKDEQWIFTQQKRTMIKVRENIIPLIPHSLFFKNMKEEESSLVMILELDQELKALPITNVLNRQEVVVKPVGEEFANLRYISGMSILGTGKVSLILDIDYLFKKEVTE